MDLPYFTGQFPFEAGDAGSELFDLLEVRRRRRGDAPVQALVLDLDHLVELTEGARHRPDALVVNGPHLPHGDHGATHLLPAGATLGGDGSDGR